MDGRLDHDELEATGAPGRMVHAEARAVRALVLGCVNRSADALARVQSAIALQLLECETTEAS